MWLNFVWLLLNRRAHLRPDVAHVSLAVLDRRALTNISTHVGVEHLALERGLGSQAPDLDDYFFGQITECDSLLFLERSVRPTSARNH